MRKLLAFLLHTLALAATCLLTSCFDVEEEIWIERDGSGRALFRYTFPDSAVELAGNAAGIRLKLESILKDQPGLRLESVTTHPIPDRGTRVDIALHSDSLLDLLRFSRSDAARSIPSGGANLLGSFDLERRGTEIELIRTIRFSHALGLLSLGISREERERRQVRYTVHLPKPVSESNAHQVLDQGTTLVWQMSLAEALREPVVVRFRSSIPLPRWLVASSVAVIVILVLLAMLALRRFLRRKRAGLTGLDLAT